MASIKKKKKNENLLQSFCCGFEGIWYCIRKEYHIQIGLAITLLLIISGFYFKLDSFEWISVLLCILFVFSLEMVNTALEVTVDIAMPNIHPLAKIAKDVVAGSVILSVMISFIIGLIIYLPKVIALFG